MLLLPLSKIYPNNQLKSIGKNSFGCAKIWNYESSTIDATEHGELSFVDHPRLCGVCLNHQRQERDLLHLRLKGDARGSESKLNRISIAHLSLKFIGFDPLPARAKNWRNLNPAKIKKKQDLRAIISWNNRWLAKSPQVSEWPWRCWFSMRLLPTATLSS